MTEFVKVRDDRCEQYKDKGEIQDQRCRECIGGMKKTCLEAGGWE